MTTSCLDVGNCATEPLLALGILSAEPYACRRDAIRSSWGQFPEATGGEVLVRFPTALKSAPLAATLAEQATHGDLVFLQTNVTNRQVGPVLTMLAWIRHAVSTPPYSRASYVAKLDDDGFVGLPELARQLRRLRPFPNVFYGMFFYSTWYYDWFNARSGRGVGESTYTLSEAIGKNRKCISAGKCSHAFPFPGAPLQVVGLDLAQGLATSPKVETYASHLRNTSEMNTKNYASEDSWLGFALTELLPAGFAGMTLASIDRFSYTFDDWGFSMKNTTFLVHDRRKTRYRARAAYSFFREHGCDSNVSIICNRREPSKLIAQQCNLKPANSSCQCTRTSRTCRRIDLKYSKYLQCPLQGVQGTEHLRRYETKRNWTEGTCDPYVEPVELRERVVKMKCELA